MSLESAIALIESVKDYRVLFVGDAIQDEYHYVHPLGKAAKEFLIPCHYLEKEIFQGGVEAAANHARTFCAEVGLCKSPSAIRKVRFVDRNYMRKVFEIHYDECVARNSLIQDGYDAIVVTDFGHDRITPAMIQDLCSRNTFLAVAAQTNSANHGFNLITKYPSADYIVIDEPEARLAANDREAHIEDVIHKLAHGRCDKFVVTHGRHGSYGYDNGKFLHQPALSDDAVLDTMGAGDAFFAVTAPMAKTGSMEDLLLIGNAAGALKCGIVGHRASVTKEALIEFLKAKAK